MRRFMKDGQVHVAVLSTTEFIGDFINGVKLETFILSEREEQPRISGLSSTDWTPLSHIEWLPTTIQQNQTEWILGITGEIF